MRILATVHHDLDLDAGAAGATLRLFAAVAEQGHDPEVRGLEAVPTWLPRQIRLALFAWRMAPVFARADVDVVDASTADAWVWSLMRRRSSPPLLVTRSHGLEHVLREGERRVMADEGRRLSLRNRLFWRYRLWEIARSLRAADVCVFLNDDERRHAVDRLGVAPERTAVVSHGIGEHFFGQPAPQHHDVPRVAFVGGLNGLKGGTVAVDVLTSALAADPDLEVTFLGSGDHDVAGAFPAEVRSRVRAVPRFANTDLPGLLAGHALVLATPYAEGFGMALVESMACGLAPVVFDVGGPRRLVEDGVTGRVVPAGDVRAAAAALVGLAADADLLLTVRRAAQAHAATFTWERAAAEIVEIYTQHGAVADAGAATKRAGGRRLRSRR